VLALKERVLLHFNAMYFGKNQNFLSNVSYLSSMLSFKAEGHILYMDLPENQANVSQCNVIETSLTAVQIFTI
jgi:hypothetical protein